MWRTLLSALFADEVGSQGDTLIFSVSDRAAALEFEVHLGRSGFGTKILPEALDWHYAGGMGAIFLMGMIAIETVILRRSGPKRESFSVGASV